MIFACGAGNPASSRRRKIMPCICTLHACRRWDFEKEQNSEEKYKKKYKKKLQVPDTVFDSADGNLFCGAVSGKRDLFA